MRTYPTKTNNKNVPANVYLIAESSQCSGDQNLLAWFGFEETANRLLRRMEETE